MKKSFRAGFCAVLCAVALSVPLLCQAYADVTTDDIQAEINKIQKENENRKNQIANLGSDIADNEKAIKLISDQIDGVNEEITKFGQLIIAKQDLIDLKKSEIELAGQKISEKDLEIEGRKSEIESLKAKNKSNLEKFAKLARALYMTDMSSSLPILSGSDDWYNYFVYSDVVKNISSQNLTFMKQLMASIDNEKKLIDNLNVEIEKLDREKSNLQKQKTELENEMTALESEKDRLEKYAKEQKNYLYSLAAENKALKDKIDSLEYDIKASNKKLDELDKELQKLIQQAQQDGSGSKNDYSSGLRWPLEPKFRRITTQFGWDNSFGGRNHGGIDVAGGPYPIGSTNIYAVQSGKVIAVYNSCPHDAIKHYSCGCGGGFGNYIIIDHGGGVSTLYAHCRKVFVQKGQQVSRGDVIALVGCTGWSTGDHLHFEVRKNGYRVDPFKYNYEYYN